MKYCIADHIIEVNIVNSTFAESSLKSFAPFVTSDDSTPLCSMNVDDELHTYPKPSLRLVRDVDTGNGVISVYRHHEEGVDVGYQFIIRDISGYACALLKADNKFSQCYCALRGDEIKRTYGMNSVMMLAFAFSTGRSKTLLIHASMVRHNDMAYAFIAQSGTGKSTQVSNWLKNIPNCDLMNDDNPIFRIVDGQVIAYGSPWSGKTPCYRNVRARLGGVAKIVRDDKNFLERLDPITSFTEILTSCSMMKWDEDLYKNMMGTVSDLVALVPVFNLHCLPNAESAIVACNGMTTN